MTLIQRNRQLTITTPLGEDYLQLREFAATETISELFAFELKLVREENSADLTPTVVDPVKLLGQKVSVQIRLPDETSRRFNGVVSQWRQGNRDTRFTYYQAVVVPKVWLLTQRRQSRIFQRLSVPDILKKVFKGYHVKYELGGTFKRREYCVQYQETDFAFASRLMEEEGIFYFFEHRGDDHTMILANTPLSHPACPERSRFPFEADLTRTDGAISSIITWETAYQLQSGKVTVWDHNFELPNRKLEADQPSIYPVADNAQLEIFQYPGEYAKRYTGVEGGGGDQKGELQNVFEDNRRQAELRMQAIDADYATANGSSNCCSLTAGHKFEIFNHPAKGVDGAYLLTQMTHHAVQSPSLVTGEPAENPYHNSFSCLSLKAGSAPFRPQRRTPKARIYGTQTAIVAGPDGEEIFTDKYGRVKVQFHWDRIGQYDAESSCWIRVAQGWAGNGWGAISLPRIGQEVVVEFLEGDPDRPLITGAVYNPAQMPPYELPEEKTKSTNKSMSSKDGSGFNEIRFEDKKGFEQVFVHAERDLDARVKFDARYWTGNDSHTIVGQDRLIETKRDRHETISRDTITEIGRDLHLDINGKAAVNINGSYSLSVSGGVAEHFGGNHSETTEGVHLIRGGTLILEAVSGISLRVGGSFITITPAGVSIVGPVVQSLPPIVPGGGAPLTAPGGQLVSPLNPRIADIADDALPGEISVNASHQPGKNKDKVSWIEIRLLDEETGEPVAGEYYKITLPDGATLAEGTLDEKGEARVEGIDPGNCRVTFPNRERKAWEKA